MNLYFIQFFHLLFKILDEAKDSVTSIQVSDYEILTGSADGCIRRYDLRNGKMTVDFIGSKSYIKDIVTVLVLTHLPEARDK